MLQQVLLMLLSRLVDPKQIANVVLKALDHWAMRSGNVVADEVIKSLERMFGLTQP